MRLLYLKMNNISRAKSIFDVDKFKLYDMEIAKGVLIECVVITLFNIPILYLVKNCLLSIRKRNANKIEVGYV